MSTTLHRKSINKLIFVALILFPSLLIGQKCSYEKNEVDAITEFQVKITRPELLCRINGQPVYIKAQCIGPHKYLKLQYYKYSNYVIQEDREIALVPESGEEIILFPRTMPGDSTKMDTFDTGLALLIFKLSDSQYQTLKSSPLIKFRYYLVSGWVEEEIKGSKQTKLIEALTCIE
jgi:hypothetical protein